jgi:hypothetical protein
MVVPLSNPKALLLRACSRRRYTVPNVKLPMVVDRDDTLATEISLLSSVIEPFCATVTGAISTRYRKLRLKYDDDDGGGVQANVMLVSVVTETRRVDTLPGWSTGTGITKLSGAASGINMAVTPPYPPALRLRASTWNEYMMFLVRPDTVRKLAPVPSDRLLRSLNPTSTDVMAAGVLVGQYDTL